MTGPDSELCGEDRSIPGAQIPEGAGKAREAGGTPRRGGGDKGQMKTMSICVLFCSDYS